VRQGGRKITLKKIGAMWRDDLVAPLDMVWCTGPPPEYVGHLRQLPWIAAILDGKKPPIEVPPAVRDAILDFDSPDAQSVEGVVGALTTIVTWLATENAHELPKFTQVVKNAPGLEFTFFPLPGQTYAREHLEKRDPYRVEPMHENEGLILVDGNTLSALGCLMGGCSLICWYPITPSSSLAETLISQFEKFRVDPATGAHRFADVQCEDELASIGAVLGAGWAGARAMTTTSGPGISLMSEFVGLGYYAEVPAVIFDVQRVGPSTGLPTRTSQGDILLAAYCSHGDTEHLALLPGTPEECYEFARIAFDYAERFQTPVFVLSDLDLGMNYWRAPKPQYPTGAFDRGKVLSEKDLEAGKTFRRYLDADGDGIPYRTLPGNPHPQAAYFTRGSGHDEDARYSESNVVFARNLARLKRKTETARRKMPRPWVELAPGAKVGLIAYGSTDHAMREARAQLSQRGIETSYLRIRALPLATDEIRAFLERHERSYLIEQNRDGQMEVVLRANVRDGALTDRLRSVRHFDGLPIDARTVSDGVATQES